MTLSYDWASKDDIYFLLLLYLINDYQKRNLFYMFKNIKLKF